MHFSTIISALFLAVTSFDAATAANNVVYPRQACGIALLKLYELPNRPGVVFTGVGTPGECQNFTNTDCTGSMDTTAPGTTQFIVPVPSPTVIAEWRSWKCDVSCP
ncbi:hypothetical protein BKA67DRAFT_570787 [Truncatella angustata]|uniref:Uncharacterized protein n=1 Tax=Truncatella angustata TaxID=152316 RepID=A0A9P8UKI3_9PEZI|nr:uncharacterized protein BKA67DRAFT_570787 [Truncatella angustata]KAH6653660.1 hypothetical protein BKA67DRAFT_570787 [Truncatella angustata]